MQATIPGEQTSASGAVAGTPFNLLTAEADVKFDADGKLTTPAASPGTIDIAVPSMKNGATDLSLKLNAYDPNGAPTFTQVSAASSTSKTTGRTAFAPGRL